MNVHKIIVKTEQIITDNSPLILTAIGVAGTLTTAYLTGKASFRAALILEEPVPQGYIKDRERTKREAFDLVWTLYIPAAGSALGTCTCIILANRIGTRRAAAVAAAYTIAQEGFGEYRAKVLETIGKNKEQGIRDKIAEDQVARNLDATKEIIISDGHVLVHEAYTGRIFSSTVEKVNKAVNEINKKILGGDDFATISDFYDKLGIKHTAISGQFGWNTSNTLEVDWTAVPREDEEGRTRAVMSFDYARDPVMKPWSRDSF